MHGKPGGTHSLTVAPSDGTDHSVGIVVALAGSQLPAVVFSFTRNTQGASALSTPSSEKRYTMSAPLPAAQTALQARLLQHREELTRRWIDVVHGTYPFETIGFLRTRKDRFMNPVGHRTDEAAQAVIDAVLTPEVDESALGKALEEIVRVRAVQDFPPETAIGMFFALKDILRTHLAADTGSEAYAPALRGLETRIDAIVLMAFGAYARCREKLFRMKVEETQRRYSQIVRLARKYGDVPETPENPGPGHPEGA